MHHDWTTLSEHLAADFPEIQIGVVVREVRAAKIAAESVALPDDDALNVGELIVRYQLMLLSGRAVDGARLKPEHHHRRARA